MSYYFKNHDYDAWIHWNVTSYCNLDCSYCFGHNKKIDKINVIDTDRLTYTLSKSGKKFRISFTGGEPFLIPNIISACEMISKEHFISFNTNLVSERIKNFAERIDPQKVIRIHASYHPDGLKAHKQTHRYIGNFKLLESKGFPMYAEAVAHPSFSQRALKMTAYLADHGIELNYGPFYGEYECRSYPSSYTNEELEIFGLRENARIFFEQKGAFCNAGFNALVAFHDGRLMPCFQFKESCGNIYEEIKFNNSIKMCPFKNCGCPLNIYDEKLYLESLRKVNII